MIGVFDSGIGGLSVLQALRRELPFQDVVYVADNAHAPYGEREAAHVLARSRAVTQALLAHGITALVVACNTATAAAIAQLRLDHPGLPIVGVEPALKPAVALSRTGHIGVMATRGTLTSDKFQALLAAQPPQVCITVQACDGLADAIEHDTAGLRALCTAHLRAMGRFGDDKDDIDTLVLGCTHYPLIAGLIADIVGPAVALVSNGDAVARQTRKLLASPDGAGQRPGRVRWMTTGDAGLLQAAARRWLEVNAAIERIGC